MEKLITSLFRALSRLVLLALGLVFVASLMPVFWGLWRWWDHNLTANPIVEALEKALAA